MSQHSPQKKLTTSTSATSIVDIDQWNVAANDESAQGFLKSTLLTMLEEGSRELHLEQEADFCRVRVRVNGRLAEQKQFNPTLVEDLLDVLTAADTTPNWTQETPTSKHHTRVSQDHFGDWNIPVQIAGNQSQLNINHYSTVSGRCLTLSINAEVAIPETLEQTRLDTKTKEKLRQHFGSTSAKGVTIVCSDSEETLRSVYSALLGEVNDVERKTVSLQETHSIPVPRISHVNPNAADCIHSLVSTATKYSDQVFVDWSVSRHKGLLETLPRNKIVTVFWLGTLAAGIHEIFATNSGVQSCNGLGTLIELRDIGIICPHCAETYKPHRRDFLKLPGVSKKPAIDSAESSESFFYAPGCSRCDHSGVSTTKTVASVSVSNDAIRKSVAQGSLQSTESAITKAQGRNSIASQFEQLTCTGQVSFEDWVAQRP